MRRRILQFVEVARTAGVRSAVLRVFQRALRPSGGGGWGLPVAREDLLATRPGPPPVPATAASGTEPLQVAWVVPSIGLSSGGHQDILRIVAHLERARHRCRILLYDPAGSQSVSEFRRIAADHYTPVAAEIRRFASDEVGEIDALIATSWQTAYPVAAAPGPRHRFYFVQDFEPTFYAVGTEYILAENTYRLGLRGITLGRWLSTKLADGYGMHCDHIDFQADLDEYRIAPESPQRRGVAFYARPISPRRAYDLGMLALELFAARYPDEPIHLFGWPLEGWEVPFEHTAHGVLGDRELNALYNRTRAGLVLSLTNLSLIPLELLASGCIPVINTGPNNEMNLQNPYIEYTAPTPEALAEALGLAIERSKREPDLPEAASASVGERSWAISGDQFETILRNAE